MRKIANSFPPRADSAFTLLELLVSSAVIGMVMAILLSATSTSMGLWRNSEQRIAVDREGRNGLALLADDVAGVLVNTSSVLRPTFRAGTAIGSSANPWSGSGDIFMEFPMLRPRDYQQSGATNDGDVCYVRYRCVADADNTNNTMMTFSILRNHVDSGGTFAGIAASSGPAAGNYEMLATNVTFFSVTTYDASGAPTTDQSKIVTVNLSLGVADKQEVENIKKGIPMPEGKSSKQFFSVNASIR